MCFNNVLVLCSLIFYIMCLLGTVCINCHGNTLLEPPSAAPRQLAVKSEEETKTQTATLKNIKQKYSLIEKCALLQNILSRAI